MIDIKNLKWTKDGLLMICENGAMVSIAEGMTDQYILESINSMYADPIPDVVEMAPARLAFLEAGLLQYVDQAISALPEPQQTAARIEWEYRPRVNRHSDLVRQLALALKLDDTTLDSLF